MVGGFATDPGTNKSLNSPVEIVLGWLQTRPTMLVLSVVFESVADRVTFSAFRVVLTKYEQA